MSLSKEEGYLYVEVINWVPKGLQHGAVVKLKKVPFKIKLFKL
ncbi:hypothetical protein [Candidatus Methylobacter favarea]|nr:hypothetical protein [Candidatus Methylobacter favarea]